MSPAVDGLVYHFYLVVVQHHELDPYIRDLLPLSLFFIMRRFNGDYRCGHCHDRRVVEADTELISHSVHGCKMASHQTLAILTSTAHKLSELAGSPGSTQQFTLFGNHDHSSMGYGGC